MIDRVRRLMVVALDGTLVPATGSRIRIERARGERTLYREVAQISRSDAGVARAASRWGLLARLPPAIEVIAKQLGAYFSARRDDQLAAERSASATTGSDERLHQAVGRAVTRGLEVAIERIRREWQVSDEDMAALREAAATADLSSPAAFRASTTKALQSIRRRYPESGPLPRWAIDLDGTADLGASVEKLSDRLEAVGRASATGEMARAIGALQELMPAALSTTGDDDERDAILAPLVEVMDEVVRGVPPAGDEADGAETTASRAVAASLLAYWKAADTPGVDAPPGVQVPHLADPDTWRTVFTFISAVPRPQGAKRWLAPERADDWRDLSIECALWRDAIDALGGVEARGDVLDTDELRGAIAALARRVGPRLGLPTSDLTELDPATPALIRERLLRWIAARCALAGVEPRPRGGAVGTEGRAILSIQDALADAEPRRRCAWPDCREFLPPRSFAHRLYCDTHLRAKATERTRRRRAAQRRSKP